MFRVAPPRVAGPWRSAEDVEFAALTWVDWFITRRLLAAIGYLPPVEFETAYHQQHGVDLALTETAL